MLQVPDIHLHQEQTRQTQLVAPRTETECLLAEIWAEVLQLDQVGTHDNFFELNPVLSRDGGPPQQLKGESSELLVAETISFIKKSSARRRPFFAVVWFGSPHEPYSGLKQDLALYDNLPASKLYRQTVRLTSNKTGRPTTRPLGDVLRERYAEITAMDRSIGQLRTWLRQAGLKKNTLLWYCGDNGSPRGASVTTPLRGEKATMYEGGVRVPGLIEWPGRISRPRVSAVNTVTSDMLPTICEIIGRPVPKRPLDGISLQPLIDGKMTERAHPICFWGFNTTNEAVGEPYIDLKLQVGTTPLVKMLAGLYTRNFQNFHHRTIRDASVGLVAPKIRKDLNIAEAIVDYCNHRFPPHHRIYPHLL